MNRLLARICVVLVAAAALGLSLGVFLLVFWWNLKLWNAIVGG